MSTPKKKKDTPASSTTPASVPTPSPEQVKALNAAVPSPNKVKPFVPLRDAERAKKRLIERHGWKEDELAVQFKTPEELLEFYNKVARQAVENQTEDEIGWDSVDSFDAPPEEKQRLNEKRTSSQREAYEKINGVSPEPLLAGAGVPADRPAAPPVSLDEFLAAGKDLEDLLADSDDDVGGAPPAKEQKTKKPSE